jgi:hypothetical protein
VLELLAERSIDVSPRTILTWAQVFGPLVARRGPPPPSGRQALVRRDLPVP